MVLDQTENFVRGDTDSSIDSSETTIPVGDASIFPDPDDGEYNVVIWDTSEHPRPDQDSDVEIMRVEGRDTSDDELTVRRGQESTSGTSHPSGSAIHLSPTAKMFGDIEDNFVDKESGGADIPNYATKGDVPSLNEGDIVYIEDENKLYVEDGE